jgi:hypothetical protein
MKFNLLDFNLKFYIGDKLSKFSNDDIIEQMDKDLDTQEMKDMVEAFDPKVHSINCFFTFFLINEHKNIIDKLYYNETFRMAFSGYCDDTTGNLQFAGYQNKEFYEFCLFLTEHDLWPDKTDVKNRLIQNRGFITRHFVNFVRMGVYKMSKGRFCKAYDSSAYTKPVRGYRLIIDELHKAGRQDLIDVCLNNSKSSLKESIYPLVLRTIADIGPEKIMNLGAEQAITEAIRIYYKERFRMGFIKKLIKVYIPKIIEFVFVFTRLFKTK